MELELRINGVIASQDIAPNESLQALLRREGYASVKNGCETGECGACTVLVDGVARPSCVMLAAQAGGCALTTVEGLGMAGNLHALQQAFIEIGAVQCGFCTPGMLLAAQALLKKNSAPSEGDVRDALSGNICRCNGYLKPVQAVLRAAAILRGEQVPAIIHQTLAASEIATPSAGRLAAVSGGSGKLRAADAAGPGLTVKIPALNVHALLPRDMQWQVVGKPVPTLNATRLAMGKAVFAGDVTMRGLLYGRILGSPHAHAIIRDIDVSKARALPGVHAVLTYKDVPRVSFSSVASPLGAAVLQDQHCLDSVVRYVGDRVAVVAAESPDVAEQALQLIHVDYEVLPAILDPRQAMAPVAPRVHSETDSYGIHDAVRNVAARVRADVGDVDQGFALADVVIEREYYASPTQPVPLENHTVVTYFDEDDHLIVRTSCQAPHHIRRTLAHILGLPVRHIRVVKPDIAGSFGSKQELVLEDLCAWLTVVTHRPVVLAYSRAEEFRSSRVHAQAIMRVKTGLKRDGTIVANQLSLLVDTGAYATHALITRPDLTCALALYPCAHMRYSAEVLYSNHAPASAFHSYELQQEFFALESQMQEISRELGMDALELRRKNYIRAGDTYPLLHSGMAGREVVESCGLAVCLRIVEEKLNWDERHRFVEEGRLRHGVGISLAMYGAPVSPSETSGAIIKLNSDGSFDVYSAVSDSGNGTTTLVAQICAEVLGVSIDDVLIHATDTDNTSFETGVSDTSALYGNGAVVKKAAEQMRRQILSVAGRMLNALPESLKIQQGVIMAPNEQHVSIPQVAEHSLYTESRHLMTSASWKMQATPVTFAAQGVSVEVDTETGAVRVLKVVSAVDCGNVLNPQIFEGQIQGSVAQALGVGLSEELLYDQQGQLLTTNLSDYRLYSAPDMPEVQTFLVTTSDATGPFGAKSVADVALYGIAPSIANAVTDAVDVKIRQLPLSPERVLRALHAKMAKR